MNFSIINIIKKEKTIKTYQYDYKIIKQILLLILPEYYSRTDKRTRFIHRDSIISVNELKIDFFYLDALVIRYKSEHIIFLENIY